MPSVPAWNIGHEIGTRETVHFKASVEYGMRAVLYLAEKGSIRSSREVADEMSIPRDYLIQLAQLLRNAGIVHARPGKNGGYSLAKDASEISMLDIFNALQTTVCERSARKRRMRAICCRTSLLHVPRSNAKWRSTCPQSPFRI